MAQLSPEFEQKVEAFLAEVNAAKDEYNTANGFTFIKGERVQVAGGTKYLKLETVEANSRVSRVWGFISTVDGTLHGAPVKVGDLLKAATWKAPAKHARGNILDGTARYGPYGPEYLIGF
jgi:hypothetical protein